MPITTARISEKIKEEYERLLCSKGDYYLYRHILGTGILNRQNVEYPEIFFLNQAEAFFALYRQTGNERFFVIGKVLRRAAHRLYRTYRRLNEGYPQNARFLNLIKS